MSVPRRQHVSLGIDLSYLEWPKTGNQEPLLLLHGLGDHALVWEKLGAALASHYHVVALDLRGHGNSAKPDSGYCFRDYSNDLDNLCGHLGWSRLNLLGHSWGAKVAAVWTTQNPERVQRLILADPFVMGRLPLWWRYTFPLGYRALPFLKLLGTFADYEQAEAIACQLKQYRGWSEWQQRIFQASLEALPDGRYRSKFTKVACDEIFLDILRVEGLGKTLRMPTLFLQPKSGLNRFAWQLKPYKKYCTQLEIQEIPGHHWAHIVEPDMFNAAVKTFLENA